MIRKRLFLVLFLLAFAAPVWAQDPDETPQRTEPVVVTVSAQELPASSVSASVTILSREMIEASEAESVLDLLQEAPFLHVSQTGGAGGLASVSLRGGDPNFTLVLIDGIPVNDPTNLLGGSYDFSNLSTDQIERIEIVRGPLSSTYGSEAISGVIHIISRKGPGPSKLTLEARGGNFSSHEMKAALEGRESGWSYGISGSYYDVEQDPSESTLNRKTLAANALYDSAEHGTLNLTARFTSAEVSGFPENGGGPIYSILRDLELTDSTESLFGARYQYRFFSVDFDFFQHLNDSFTPAILDSIPPGFQSLPSFINETDFDRTRLQWTGFWKRGPWSGSIGASWKSEDGNSTGLIADFLETEFDLQRTTYATGAEILFESGNLNVSAGVRIDFPEDFDSEVSPRVGITWMVPESSTRLHATWGEGYKLPSFFSLADPNIGNPDLLPERSQAWDIGVDQELFGSRGFVSIAWFHNSFQDLIDFSSESFRLVNRREVISEGFELEGRFDLHPKIRWTAHLGYTDADIQDSSEPLRDRPKWRGGVGLDWSVSSRANMHVNYTAVGDRFDFQIPVPERTIAGEYHTVDVAASYKLMEDLTLFGRVDNLFDSNYQEFVGFPNPGTYFRAGLRWQPSF